MGMRPEEAIFGRSLAEVGVPGRAACGYPGPAVRALRRCVEFSRQKCGFRRPRPVDGGHVKTGSFGFAFALISQLVWFLREKCHIHVHFAGEDTRPVVRRSI
jgi:hypothetical protein